MQVNHMNKNERGFILMTSLILLAILTGLGVAAMFKTNVEIKVSAGSMGSAKAFAAAQSGLDYTYHYWSQNATGKTEFKDLVKAAKFVTGGTVTAVPILIDSGPESLSELGNTTAVIDAWVKAAGGVRVYNLDGAMTKTTAANWGVDTYAQVAVWAARFKPSATGYPYADFKTKSESCSDCTVVAYALGRAGDTYKLMREYTSISNQTIQAFGAMVNAPRFKNDADCLADTASTSSSTVTNVKTAPVNVVRTPPTTTLGETHLIDATQAPGGVAMASNNGIDTVNTNKPWNTITGANAQVAGTGTALKGIVPYVIYDPGKVSAVDYPKIDGGLMSDLYATVVKADLFSSSRMNYFDSATDQLFQLNAYREAANRISGFANERIGTLDVYTNGVMLGNAQALKAANGGHARMGTINWNDVQYNIANNVPMYGLLRLMIPVYENGTWTVCGKSVVRYNPVMDPLAGTDAQGKYVVSPNGKLIVYGGALFDFYIDSYSASGNIMKRADLSDSPGGGDGIYQPDKERLVKPEEAMKKLNVNSPLMFNPAMDGVSPKSIASALPASTNINRIDYYPKGSPSWNRATDASANADGAMDLIWDVNHIARNWSTKVHDGVNYVSPFSYTGWMTQESPQVITSTATGTPTHTWSTTDKADMKSMLDYYIKTTAAASKSTWSHKSVSSIEGEYTKFKIQSASDLTDTYSAADLYHSFLPSGYVHGWKRAMMETGLTAVGSDGVNSIWNTDLIADDSPYAGSENVYFNITGTGNSAVIDKDFADIPAEMYAGGLVDMHHNVNISGVVYTPDMFEFEQKEMGKPTAKHALQYVNGIIITGGGVYMKNEDLNQSLTVIAYDDTSIDNLPTNKETFQLSRKYWQELK